MKIKGGELVGLLEDLVGVTMHRGDTVAVQPYGTGVYGSADGYGWPVVVEFDPEDLVQPPRVLIWADINQEDPTHIISLAQAMESTRLIHDKSSKPVSARDQKVSHRLRETR